MELRSKLVCNLGPKDRFLHPLAEGVWRRTDKTVKLTDGKWYEIRRVDGDDVSHLKGRDRVDLITEGEADEI